MQKKKSGVKKCLEILPLRGGAGPLMANAILNFHFDYVTPSLSVKYCPECKRRKKSKQTLTHGLVLGGFLLYFFLEIFILHFPKLCSWFTGFSRTVFAFSLRPFLPLSTIIIWRTQSPKVIKSVTHLLISEPREQQRVTLDTSRH